MLEAFSFTAWKQAMDEHIQIAIALHDIRDVYIVEHRSCGAYSTFLNDGNFATGADEKKSHAFFAKALSKEINDKEYADHKGGTYRLHVHSFLMDLRGNVELLHTTNKPK